MTDCLCACKSANEITSQKDAISSTLKAEGHITQQHAKKGTLINTGTAQLKPKHQLN